MVKEQNNDGYRGDRVRQHTSEALNRQIDQKIQQTVQAYAMVGPEAIEDRIRELEREWDIERLLELNASLLAFSGVLLGLRSSQRWFALPLLVLPFLLQHAVQGWCPPIPFLRRMGMRTQREIEAEKYALKALHKRKTSQTRATPASLSVGLV